ncbi:MAG: flagellar biosynthesis anti-sigma factor FlgM [Thermodesulfovibrionales bacterium]
MKIQGGKPPEANEVTLSAQKAKKVSESGERDRISASKREQNVDRIDISQKGKEIASLIASVNNLPEVREEKVQAIKEAVNGGTYKVDPIKVAEKMLSEI